MKFKTVLVTLLLISGLSGCTTLKEVLGVSKDVGIAVVSVPHCRAEWEDYMPIARQEAVADDFRVLDKLNTQLLTLAKKKPSMSFLEALEEVTDTPEDMEKIKKSFESVVLEAKLYAAGNTEINQILLDCETIFRKGWKSATDNELAQTILEGIKVLKPYVKILPLILL
jgi:hypothetical protein